MNKKLVLPTVLVLAILLATFSAAKVKAHQSNNYPAIVQKIADKFNLNVSDVEEVFDEERDLRRADMYAYFAERLNDLVADEKITEDQKNVILEHHEEMQNQMESLNSLTHEERMERMREIHNSFKELLEEEGVDTSLLGQINKVTRGNRHHFMMMH